MKKKFLVSLIVVCVLLPAALSAAIVDLSLGATAQYADTLGTVKTYGSDYTKFTDINNYTFGADVRVKLLIAEVDIVGTFGTPTINSIAYTEISALTTAGVSLDLLGLVRVGFGMGPRWKVLVDNSTGKLTIKDNNGNLVPTENLGETFLTSPVAYRATADFNLGSIMLGVNYTLDTNYTFKNYQEVNKLFDAAVDNGKLGVSVLFSLF